MHVMWIDRHGGTPAAATSARCTWALHQSTQVFERPLLEAGARTWWSRSLPFPCAPEVLAWGSPHPSWPTPPSWLRPAPPRRGFGIRIDPLLANQPANPLTALPLTIGGRHFAMWRLASSPRSSGRSTLLSLPRSSFTPGGCAATTPQTRGLRPCWPSSRPLLKAPDDGPDFTPAHANQIQSSWTPCPPPFPSPCPTRTSPPPLVSAWPCWPGRRTLLSSGVTAGPPSSCVTPIIPSHAPALPCSGRRAMTLSQQDGAVLLPGRASTSQQS
jgi:hypothetical protein